MDRVDPPVEGSRIAFLERAEERDVREADLVRSQVHLEQVRSQERLSTHERDRVGSERAVAKAADRIVRGELVAEVLSSSGVRRGVPRRVLPGPARADQRGHRVARGRRPDLVLVPSREDAHQDHRLLGELAPTVLRDHLVLEYEIPK